MVLRGLNACVCMHEPLLLAGVGPRTPSMLTVVLAEVGLQMPVMLLATLMRVGLCTCEDTCPLASHSRSPVANRLGTPGIESREPGVLVLP